MGEKSGEKVGSQVWTERQVHGNCDAPITPWVFFVARCAPMRASLSHSLGQCPLMV